MRNFYNQIKILAVDVENVINLEAIQNDLLHSENSSIISTSLPASIY